MVTTNEYATTTKATRRPIRGLRRASAPLDGSTWTHPRGWSGHGRHTLGHPAGARLRHRTTGRPPPVEHVWHPLRSTTCDGSSTARDVVGDDAPPGPGGDRDASPG